MMFENDPMNGVYSFVEKAYTRLQAGDVLFRCLEEENTAPIQEWVEGLVLAGPRSLVVLREILNEVDERKRQSKEDIHQVFQDFRTSLKSCGVPLTSMQNERALIHMTPEGFLSLICDQGISQQETQIVCLQLLNDANDLIKDLEAHLSLLIEIEVYISDWLWGLVYESAQRGWTDDARDIIN
jgi:hypothetical protein